MNQTPSPARDAVLYRMVLPDHTCPYGVAAKEMLEKAGYAVEDNILSSREDVDGYKAKEGVDTTPQVFIAGKRIGGAEALSPWLAEQGAPTPK
jgi:glutaredoxin 3